MNQAVQPTYRYSRDDYQRAVDNYLDGGSAAPACLRYTLGRRYPAIQARWNEMSLEDKVSQIATSIGYYVRGTAEDLRHVITYGYEMMCRRGQLSDR